MKKPNRPIICAVVALVMTGNATFASEPSDSTATATSDTTGVVSLNEVEIVAERVIIKATTKYCCCLMKTALSAPMRWTPYHHLYTLILR